MTEEPQSYTIVVSMQKPSGENHQSDVRIWRFNIDSDIEQAFEAAVDIIGKIYARRVK